MHAIRHCASVCNTLATMAIVPFMAKHRKGRAMINSRIRTKLFNVIFFAACILAFIVSGCSSAFDGLQVPTASTQPTATRTARIPTATNTILSIEPEVCTVTAYTLNLRAGPSMSHAVKQILHKGQTLTVIRHGAWLKVSTRGATGFIYGRFCK